MRNRTRSRRAVGSALSTTPLSPPRFRTSRREGRGAAVRPAGRNMDGARPPVQKAFGAYDSFHRSDGTFATTEFVVRYMVNGETFWDNNDGANYHIDAIHPNTVGGNLALNRAGARRGLQAGGWLHDRDFRNRCEWSISRGDLPRLPSVARRERSGAEEGVPVLA